MSNFIDMKNNNYFSEEEYENWEEYLSDDDIDVEPVRTPPAVKKESEEEKQARIASQLADLAVISGHLNWVEEEKKYSVAERELDIKEYPILGTNATKDKPLKLPRMSSITNSRKLVITGKSYAEKHREKQRDEVEKDTNRTKAFSLLANKEMLEKKLEKTRMCNSIDKKEKCPHGDKCRFAHSLEELNISKCFFGDDCRYIKNAGGKVLNCGGKVCPHRHPNETTNEFYTRTNLVRFKKEESKVLDLTSIVENSVKKEKEFNNDRTQGINWASKVKSIQTPVVSEKKETVLRVPRELAVQAMELAMKGGNGPIRVEII